MSTFMVLAFSFVVGFFVGRNEGRLWRFWLSDIAPVIETPIRTRVELRVAVHEAGHAVCAWFNPYVKSIDHITLENQQGNGHVLYSVSDKTGRNDAIWANIVVCLGGIAAEATEFGKFRAIPARGDITEARDLARMLVARAAGPEPGALFCPWDITVEDNAFDMSTVLRSIERNSGETRVLNLCYQRAKQLIASDPQRFHRVMETLLQKGELGTEDITKIFGQRHFYY